MMIEREHYRFFNEESNIYLSNLKLAIEERVWVSFFCYAL